MRGDSFIIIHFIPHRMESTTLTNQKSSKKSTEPLHKGKGRSDPHADELKSTKIDPLIKDELIPLTVTPVSPSPPPSNNDGSPTHNHDNPETSSITHEPINDSTILPSNGNKRSSENSSIDEGFFPSKRSRLSQDSLDNKGNVRSSRLTYQDISLNDLLLVKCNLKQKKEHWGRCLQKNNDSQQLFIQYQGFDSTSVASLEISNIFNRRK